MSGGGPLAIGTFLLVVALAAAPATPAKKGTAATAPAAASARASAPAAAASAPTEFSGSLIAGETYVADVFFDARALHIWRPVKEVFPGKDVAWTIAWTNLDQFPALKTTATQAHPQRMRFRVVKTDLLSGSPKLPWMATYRCEILAVEPLPTPPAPKAAHKR
ncbi:MAG TPA: hypothetical protein VH041_16735 [Caldimonas sp.]|jgi:hypothetical protein|nr:hypothetical protein [Caldimonas sp.]HEX4235939.1 hypothetical protein [Caldimonas sp.]